MNRHEIGGEQEEKNRRVSQIDQVTCVRVFCLFPHASQGAVLGLSGLAEGPGRLPAMSGLVSGIWFLESGVWRLILGSVLWNCCRMLHVLSPFGLILYNWLLLSLRLLSHAAYAALDSAHGSMQEAMQGKPGCTRLAWPKPDRHRTQKKNVASTLYRKTTKCRIAAALGMHGQGFRVLSVCGSS